LERLIEISKEYERLKLEYSQKAENQFIQIAKKIGKEKKLSNKELIIQITKEVLNSNLQSINQFLLIRLMWDLGKTENQFCIKTLEKWIRRILKSDTIGHKEEYYLESLIDIWNYNTDELIPIDILQQIILLDSEELKNSYGAMIKAVSYLSDHPKIEVEKVLSKARATKKYKEDEYYQEWIA